MNNENDIQEISIQLKDYGFPIHQHRYSYDDLLNTLSYHINQLITSDFPALIQLLYRLDISEQQIKKTLKDTTGDLASRSIAQLVVERQFRKLDARKMFKKNDNIPDDERW